MEFAWGGGGARQAICKQTNKEHNVSLLTVMGKGVIINKKGGRHAINRMVSKATLNSEQKDKSGSEAGTGD